MTRLITPESIAALKDMGKKLDVSKINPIIDQAQDVDLRDWLGRDFYFDMMANQNDASYQALLDGSDFTVANQNPQVTYHHEGIRSLLIDLFMSRFVLQVNTNFTPFGATVKHSDDSEPAERNSLRDISTMHKEMANAKWEMIKLYLQSDTSRFPIYNAGCSTSAPSERRFKFKRL